MNDSIKLWVNNFSEEVVCLVETTRPLDVWDHTMQPLTCCQNAFILALFPTSVLESKLIVNISILPVVTQKWGMVINLFGDISITAKGN